MNKYLITKATEKLDCKPYDIEGGEVEFYLTYKCSCDYIECCDIIAEHNILAEAEAEWKQYEYATIINDGVVTEYGLIEYCDKEDNSGIEEFRGWSKPKYKPVVSYRDTNSKMKNPEFDEYYNYSQAF